MNKKILKENTIRKGSIYITIASFSMLASGYLINIGLGRYLGPQKYGIYGIIISLVSTINIALSTGLPQAVSKLVSENPEKANAILKKGLLLQMLSSILIAAGYFLGASVLAETLKDKSLLHLLELSALIIPLNALYSLYLGYYNGLHLFNRQAIIDIFYSIAKIVGIFIFLFLFQLEGIIYGYIFAAFIASLAAFRFPNKNEKNFPYKKIIMLSIPLVCFSILSYLSLSLDLILVKVLVSNNTEIGYYNASQNISRIPYFALNSMAIVMYPKIARSISQNLTEKTTNLINSSTRIILILLVPLMLVISGTSSTLVQLLYSKEYLSSSGPLSILVIGVGFLTLFTLQSNILNGAGKIYISILSTSINIIITGFFCFLLIPHLGLMGAAISAALGNLFSIVPTALNLYKKFYFSISYITVIRIVIASIAVYLLAIFTKVSPIILPIFYIILFAIYFILLFLLKELKLKELLYVKSMFVHKRRKLGRDEVDES